MTKIRAAIYGYGNLGKALERRLKVEPDIDLVCIFSRRQNISSPYSTKVEDSKNVLAFKDQIDILCLCSGSASDGTRDALCLAPHFNIITTFDTHKTIPDLYSSLNKISSQSKTLAIMSVGWDPGLFSVARCAFTSILGVSPSCFWGKGTSLGHTEAAKGVQGVKDALAITIPNKSELERARQGKKSSEAKHSRLVCVTPEPNADLPAIEKEIKSIKHYFDSDPTTVLFMNQTELDAQKTFSHGGLVTITDSEGASMELSCTMSSNPDFTARIVTAHARVFKKLKNKYSFGALTPLHISPLDLSADDEITTIKKYC